MKYLLTLTVVLMVACQPKKGEETASDTNDLSVLKEEVMALHDEVMPKMGELRKLSKELDKMADSLYLANDSSMAQGFAKAAKDLIEANESMMVWMRQYEPNLEAEKDSLTAYYTSQRDQIYQVNRDMKRELREGQALID